MRPQQRPQSIDRAALTRQFLAAAVDRACDQVLPDVTACNTALPQHADRQNEATAGAAAAAGGQPSPYLNSNKRAAPAPVARDTVLPGVTPRYATLPNSADGKTNPPRRATLFAHAAVPLDAQQLAAARLLACGRLPVEVATELGIHRQTLWRWRRMPHFQAELFRLHECLTWTAGATTARRRTPT